MLSTVSGPESSSLSLGLKLQLEIIENNELEKGINLN